MLQCCAVAAGALEPAVKRFCRAAMPGGLCSWRVSPGWAEVALCLLACEQPGAVQGSGALATSPLSLRVPLAAPDCARQNCRCQALHGKRARREGRERPVRRGWEFRISLLLCWCVMRGALVPQPIMRHD